MTANIDMTARIELISRCCSSHANPQSDFVVNMRQLHALDRVASHHQPQGPDTGPEAWPHRQRISIAGLSTLVRCRWLVGISRRNDHSVANSLVDCWEGKLPGVCPALTRLCSADERWWSGIQTAGQPPQHRRWCSSCKAVNCHCWERRRRCRRYWKWRFNA